MMRPSTTHPSVRRRWPGPARFPARQPASPFSGPRTFASRGPSWRVSLLSVAIPAALLLATLAYHVSASDAAHLVVTDQFSGAPLSSARITLGDRVLTTDSHGRVTLPSSINPFSLRIALDQYAPKAGKITAPRGQEIAVALRPTTVKGRLTDQTSGAPISGATVAAVTSMGAGPLVKTTADGSYTLANVPANARLRIDAGDYGVIEEPIEHRVRIDQALKVSVITGAVRDAAGDPVAGAAISSADRAVTTVTGPDGSYRLTGAGAAPDLVITASGYADQRVSVPSNRQLQVTLQSQQVKAVYAPIGVLTNPERFNRLIQIADTTEVNAIVVDVKQDTIFYDTQVPFFRAIDGMVRPAFDPHELLATLHQHHMYVIARMVVFKDPLVAEARPDLAVKDEVKGGVWRDTNGAAWVNAFNKELWQANAELASELGTLGFDEVQYDYIRFPSDGDLKTADFGPDYSEAARRAAITGAVALGAKSVRSSGARFAVDLFPIVAIEGNDQGIGQTLQDLTPLADYVNLMIYPSHFEEGNIPVDGVPNDFPAETVSFTLQKASELVSSSPLRMRPWLQDFTYPLPGYAEYGPAQVRDQIDAAEKAGVSGWMLWNAAGDFSVDALHGNE